MDHICISWKFFERNEKTDCECLIHNFGYAVQQNHEKPEDEFLKVRTAAMEHHLITMTIVTNHGVILETTQSINQMTQFVES